MPPPPCFAWSPSPAARGRKKKSRRLEPAVAAAGGRLGAPAAGAHAAGLAVPDQAIAERAGIALQASGVGDEIALAALEVRRGADGFDTGSVRRQCRNNQSKHHSCHVTPPCIENADHSLPVGWAKALKAPCPRAADSSRRVGFAALSPPYEAVP